MGGLGIEIPSEISDVHYINSRSITSQLVTQIVTQSQTSMVNVELLKQAKLKVQSDKNARHKASVETLSDLTNIPQKFLFSLRERVLSMSDNSSFGSLAYRAAADSTVRRGIRPIFYFNS